MMTEHYFTAIDLFRIGDAGGPVVDRVRVGLDVEVITIRGTEWVVESPGGGMSTRSAAYPLRRPSSRWWRLPAGSPISYGLVVRNDHGHHWLIEPAVRMPLDTYRGLLRRLGGYFV